VHEVIPDRLPIRVNEKIVIREVPATPLPNFLKQRRVARSAVVLLDQLVESLLLIVALTLMLPVSIDCLSVGANEYTLYELTLNLLLFRYTSLQLFSQSIDLAA
jgi:hypothetical protein